MSVKSINTSFINSTLNIESTDYERVGSLIFWEFLSKRKINHKYDAIKEVFSGTVLHDYIQPVGFSEAINRFAESVAQQHGTIYGTQLEYLIQKDNSNPGYYFLSFFTGKVKDKQNTNFAEHAKMWLGDNGENIALLSKDNTFLIQSHAEMTSEFSQHWNIIPEDIMKSLRNFSNDAGYRFNSHGGHYFIPCRYTDGLYQIKVILKQFGQKLSITPLIAGCEEDIEEICEILGGEFNKQINEAEKELFEMCINCFNYHAAWDSYVKSVLARDEYAIRYNKISRTKYGTKLTQKIFDIDSKASDYEYKQIVTKLLDGIKPNKNKSVVKLYGIKEKIVNAINKLDMAAESRLINQWRNRLLLDLSDLDKVLKEVSNLLLDEVLSIL